MRHLRAGTIFGFRENARTQNAERGNAGTREREKVVAPRVAKKVGGFSLTHQKTVYKRANRSDLASASASASAPAPGPASAPTSPSVSTSSALQLPLLHKMGLVDLPVELLEHIIYYIIPKNWKYYSEGLLVLKLRLLCSKLFIHSFHFAVSKAEFFGLFQNCLIISFRTVHSAN